MSGFMRQLGFELLKLFARKRTYVGFGAYLVIELLMIMGFNSPHAQEGLRKSVAMFGPAAEHYLSGLTLAFNMILYTIYVLGSIYLALVCGDIVSKEVEDGTMRMILSRPVSRARILLLKLIACVTYTWVLVAFIFISTLTLGILDRGCGGLIVVAPWDHVLSLFEAGPGLARFAGAAAVLCLTMLTFTSLGFMFSCFNMKPATATIFTLSFYLFNFIIGGVPFFEHLKKYLLTHHMGIWVQVFQPVVPWRNLSYSLSYLFAFDLLFISLGAWYFARRDFKS